MKVLIILMLFGLSSIAHAGNIQETLHFNKKSEINLDIGKDSRRTKRINKRRKRKCRQHAKRMYAG